jgi:FkbM family methyltransferase
MENQLTTEPTTIHAQAVPERRVRALAVRVLRFVRLYNTAIRGKRALRRGRRYLLGVRSYQRALGLVRGSFTFEKFRKSHRASRAMVKVPVPGWLTPIELRPITVDKAVFEQVFVERQYDIQIHHEPRVIVDGGAHIGCTSAFFAKRYPKALVLAIEPEAANYELLTRNVRAYGNVIPIHAALWKSPRQLSIANPDADSWAFTMRDQQPGDQETVLGITIGEILRWVGTDIDILKLDVEGTEKELFSSLSAKGWLGSVHWIIIELHDRFVAGCSDEFVRATLPFRLSESISGECVVVRCSADRVYDADSANS